MAAVGIAAPPVASPNHPMDGGAQGSIRCGRKGATMSFHPGSRLFEVVLEDGRAEVRFTNAFLDERNSEAMQAEVPDLLDRLSNRQVYFDLGNIEFVSSSWLGLFVLLFRGLRSAGGRMIRPGSNLGNNSGDRRS